MKKYLFLMVLFASPVQAAWQGKLNLALNESQPVVLRELHDGQWLAGVAKPDIFHLDRDGVQWFHAGAFHAWNAEKGNPTFGFIAGVDLPKAGPYIASLAKALELEGLFKPLMYADSLVSIDGFAGYRPVHSPDVNGNFTYGVGARLNIAFGVKELQKGL